MKRLMLIITIVLWGLQCFSQNTATDDLAIKLRDYLSTAKFEEANNIFKEHIEEFDSTTCDILTSVINIGLSVQGKTINVDSTISCIRRVIKEFAEHKEDVKSMATEMMPYFNGYVSFLVSVGNPFYFDVYRLFKELWPSIDKDNSVTYIYILENTSFQAFTEQRYDEAISIFKELIDLKDLGYQLHSKPFVNYAYLGRCYQNTGDEEKAATCYDKALMDFSSGDKLEESTTYMNVVRDRFEVAFKLSQLSKCRELGKLLIDYYDSKEEYVNDYIDVSIKLGEVELTAFNTKDAIQHYEKGVQRILQSPNYDTSSKKAYLENLYTIYNTRNVSEEDRKFQAEIKKYDINTNNKITPIVVDDQYIDLLKGKISDLGTGEISNVKDYVDEVEILASHYSAKHEEMQGIKLIEAAINRCQSLHVKEQEYVKLYSSIGTIYSNLQYIDKALEYHKKARKIYKQNGMYNPDYVNILCYLADDYCYKRDFTLANAHLEEAWDISKSMDAIKTDKVVYYHLLRSYSELYRELGNEEKALAYNSMMIDDVSDNDESIVFKKVNQQARVHLLLFYNRYKEAQELLDEIGLDHIEKYGGWWTSFETKFFNDDESCVKDLEKLSEKDKEHIIHSFSSFKTSNLKDFWDVYGGNLNMAYSMALYKFNTPALRESTYNNLLFTKNFQLELNKYNRTRPNEPLTADIAKKIIDKIGDVNQIKDNLLDNEVAIELFFIKDRKSYSDIKNKYGALILKKDTPEPLFVELCLCDSLDKLVYNNTLGEAEVYADQMYNINNNTLYHLIWKPLEKEIPSHAKVFVSGCGSLLYINFSAMSNGRERLDELYDIHNVTSTSIIISNIIDKRNYQSAALFGGIDYDTSMNDMAIDAKKYAHNNGTDQYAMYRGEDERGSWGKLQFSLEETNSIATYLSDNHLIVTKYTQSDASEEAFKSLSGSSPDILHVSTHGFYYQPYVHSYLSDYSNQYFTNDNNNKLNFNGLLFSGANNAWKYNKFQDDVEDGILTAREINSLNLSNTKLLILSACQTGLGENNEIDGNEGLLRAFKVAGVNDVIITLWNISDDATSLIMKLFYQNLLEIKDPREALRTTINKVKKEMPDPYYWAPFIVIE